MEEEFWSKETLLKTGNNFPPCPWQEPPMGTAKLTPAPIAGGTPTPSTLLCGCPPWEGPAPAPSGVPAGPWGEPGGQKSKANCGSQWCGAAGGLSGCRVTLIPLS